MVHDLKITAIVENTASTFEASGEWGLALWVEADEHRIICDTGLGRTLLQNAQLLGIDLASAEALVISHGHHDHTGGVAPLLGVGFHGNVYIHPAALSAKYERVKTPPHKSIGIPAASRRALEAGTVNTIECLGPTNIAPGIMVTGAIPRRTACEDAATPFFLDENCTQPDLLFDDQALLIETQRGWIVITGCGHSGLINTLTYAKELIGSGNIVAVIGGLHLFCVPPERIKTIIENLKAFGVELLAPCHCTGFEAIGFLHKWFDGRVRALGAGLTINVSGNGDVKGQPLGK